MAVLRFGDFRIDCDNKRLWRRDDEVELRGLPFAVLGYFVQGSAKELGGSAGPLVTKADLVRAIWQGSHVSDETVRGCIRQIRRALDDDSQAPRYLRTHSREGWRWLMPATAEPSQQSVDALQPPDGPYDPAWYVERPQLDRELLSCLSFAGRPVVIHGPQGSGKTTLIARALDRFALQAAGGLRVVRVSLRSFDASSLASLDSMLHALALHVLTACKSDEEQAQQHVASIWARSLDPRSKLKRLLRAELFSSSQVTALVFSEVDALVPWPHQAAWFDLLRSWQDDEALSQLRVILASAIPPRLFPLSEHSPLWTKAARLDASTLRLDESRQLAQRHGLADQRVAVLHDLVGGSVRLLRTVLFQAALQRLDLEALLRTCTPPHFGALAEHMADLDQWLEGRSDSAQVLDGLGRAGPGVGLALPAEQAWPYLRKGLLRESERRGHFVLRCPLYEQRFAGRAG